MVDVRQVGVEQIIELRHAVLRAGLPRESARFPGDDDSTTVHFAALDVDGVVVGCLTLHLNEWESAPAYQLRGMATAPEHRRKGIGRALMRAAESFVLTTPVRTLWCNARTPAVPFYEQAGWSIVSEIFDIPTAGPHVRMLRQLNDH